MAPLLVSALPESAGAARARRLWEEKRAAATAADPTAELSDLPVARATVEAHQQPVETPPEAARERPEAVTSEAPKRSRVKAELGRLAVRWT